MAQQNGTSNAEIADRLETFASPLDLAGANRDLVNTRPLSKIVSRSGPAAGHPPVSP